MNPQNPYSSYLVNASAGSGKTYQLSHRFLCLVACGAVPDSILTITFTKKAAKEMRQRILQLASLLAHNAPLAEQFDDKVSAFYEEELQRRAEENTIVDGQAETPEFRSPRSARETAREVLAASQRLRVVTIDSIFLNWRSRFAYEASGGNDPGRKLVVADPWQLEQLMTRSFAAAFRELNSQGPSVQEAQLGPLEQWGRIERLLPLESFLWLMSRGEVSPFGEWPTEHYGEAASCARYGDWFARHVDEINELVTAVGGKKQAERLEALHSDQPVARLQAMRFLKGDGLISGAITRKEGLKATMEGINASLAVYGTYRSIMELNRQQEGLAALFAKTQTSWQAHKRRAGVLDFGDAAKGCHNLFHDREYDSARFYLQQHIVHIMIDEFQDTNLLQWGIFREMAHEILAGYDPKDSEYALRPSVFLVGDPKQSIYRFREAEAGILADVPLQLPDSGIASVVLSASYRSCPTVLDFVNMFFAEKMADFPKHQAAQIDGKTLKSDCSEVLVVEPFVVSGKSTKAKATSEGQPPEDERTEAEWVAEDIAARLAEPWRYPVAEGKRYRPLQSGDCAVLVRTNEAVLTMSRALRSLGVSASPTLSHSAGVLAKAEGLDALAVIKVLAFPRDELAWLSLLKSPLVGIPEAQLWPALADQDDHESGARRPHRSGHDLLTALLPLVPQQPLRKLLATMSSRPNALVPSAVLSQLVNAAVSRYRTAFGVEETEVALRQYRVLIHTLTSIERQWGTSPTIVYHRLLEWDQQQQIPAVSSSAEGVQIMTIHKAKGLEFPLVYATSCHTPWERTDRYWLKSTAEGKVYYIGTQKTQPKGDPTFDRLMAAEKQAEVDENLRLFYVAITRASQYLVVSGEGKKPELGYHLDHALEVAAGFESRELGGQPCRALTGADLASGRSAATSAPDTKEEPRAGAAQLLEFEPSQEPAFVPEVAILAPSRLLNDDEGEDDDEGPRKQEQSTRPDRLPIHWTHAEGTFIHSLLEQHFLAQDSDQGDGFAVLYTQHFPQGSPSHREVLSQYWENLRAFPTFDQLTEGADEVLPELPLCYLAGQTLINGSLDLVVVRGDAVTIIDFKTGQHVGAGQEAAHCKARGYDRQLALYKAGLTRLWPKKAIATEVYLTTTGVRVPLGEV